ncbi:MAG: lysophospholipid acyltransferase family protein [Pseudomonadota bacterium]
MSFKERLTDKAYYYYQVFDYRYVLPAMARLPVFLSECLVYVRGTYNALFDLDWRSLSLRKRYLWDSTFTAMRMLRPTKSGWTWRIKTTQRFIHNAREEWEASMFDRRPMEFLLRRSVLNGIQPIIKAQREGRGVLLLTSHYGSFTTGIVLLGMQGLRVHAVASAVVEQPEVHIDIRKFYWRKYRGMERYLNGGKIVHYEHSIKHFYRALEQGDVVVILGDLPGNTQTAINVPFLDKMRKMAPGALRMARRTNCLVGAFLCRHQGIGKYQVDCSELKAIESSPPETDLIPAYNFLSDYINREPERWWAADLLPHYQDADR